MHSDLLFMLLVFMIYSKSVLAFIGLHTDVQILLFHMLKGLYFDHFALTFFVEKTDEH